MRPHVLLLDIDGVLYVEDEPVGGAVAALRGCALRFVTNTTNRTRAAARRVVREEEVEVDFAVSRRSMARAPMR